MALRILLTALILLYPSVAIAQDNWQPASFFNLTGGLVDGLDPIVIGTNEASDLQNIVFTTGGSISKRQGFTNINSSASCSSSSWTGLAQYKQADGTRFLVGVCSNNTIQKMDYGAGTSGPDGTWDDITGALSFSVGVDDQADFAVAENIIVIEDGLATTAPFSWSGTGNAIALSGTAPNATMVEFHKRQLFSAGRSDARSRVDISNLDDITINTVSTDFILVETDDGQVITGLKSALDCLYVFKTESVWRICGTNTDDFVLEQMVRGIGATNNSSISIINNQFIFPTSEGDIVVYDGGIKIQVISAKIEGTLTAINQARIDEWVSVTFDDQTGDQDYYLSLSGSGSSTHNIILLYDTFHNAWTKFSGINANAMGVYEIGTLEKAIAFGDYAGFSNRYPDGTNDDGTAIAAFYQSGQIQIADSRTNTLRAIQVITNQEGNFNLTFERRLDFASSGTATSISLAGSGSLWDTAIYDTDIYADLISIIAKIVVNEPFNFYQWRVENNNIDEPFTTKGTRIWYEPTGRIGVLP